MIVFSADNISFSYGINTILYNSSFRIEKGDKVAVVGNNGCGKSMLLKLLTENEFPSEGVIYRDKNLKYGFLPQNPEIESNCSVYDEVLKSYSHLTSLEKDIENLRYSIEKNADNQNIIIDYSNKLEKYIDNGGMEYKNRAKSILKSLGFKEDSFSQTVSSLSGGQKSRLLLSKILINDPDVLILDEPTNHLDIDSIIWLENLFLNTDKTIIVVSHDRYFLSKTTNKTIELFNKKTIPYNGNYEYFIAERIRNYNSELTKYKNQQKEIKRLCFT